MILRCDVKECKNLPAKGIKTGGWSFELCEYHYRQAMNLALDYEEERHKVNRDHIRTILSFPLEPKDE